MADDDARARRTTRATTGAVAKKTPMKKAAAPVRKAVVKKAATAAKASRVQKAVVKRAAPAKKAAPARKTAAAKKAAPARGRGATLAPRLKKAPPMRLAAEQTFDDDWEAPEPEPVREDPHARIRGLLRDAALQVEGRAQAARAVAPTPAPAPLRPDEPVTRVLVAPTAPEEEEWLAEDAELAEEELQNEVEEEGEWAAPEVLEDDEMRTVASAPPPNLSTPPPPPPPTTEFAPPPFEAPAARPAPAPDAKPGRSRLRTLLKVLAALVVVGALVVGGLWAYDNFRDEGIDYSALKVGDCFDSSASNEIRGIEVKPCDQPHNSEIFFLVTHPAGPDDPYPGKDTLVQFAADACLGQPLTEYLGIPLEQSKLKDFEIVPQESAWEDGKRALVCGLDTGGEGDVSGSVRGTRR